MKLLSLVIPCFNEEDGIESTVSRIITFVTSRCTEVRYEIILVNDGSSDQTKTKIERLAQKHPEVKAHSFPENRGRGAAMKAGVALSQGDYVMFLDADLSYDVDHIRLALDELQGRPPVDAVIISPYMKGGVVKNVPFKRLALSRIANWILAGFFSIKISTVTSMVRAYRGEVIRNLPLYEDGKELHLEILRKLLILGYNVKEVPGKLIWKEQKLRAARGLNLKLVGAAKRHLLYGLLSRPTRTFGKVGLLLTAIALFEGYNVARGFLRHYESTSAGFISDTWLALKTSFAHSPHTIMIAVVTAILSAQTFFYLATITIMKIQHDELMKHVLALTQKQNAEK